MERKLQTFQPDLPSINLIILNITNLNTGESKHSFLSSFHQGVDVPEFSPLVVVEDSKVSYAPQDVQHTSAGLQSHYGSLSEDYGLVHQDDSGQVATCPYNPQQCVGGVNLYMAQTRTTEPAQERYEKEEEEMQMFCNWDRDPGQLQVDFPLLSRFGSETPETTETQTMGDTTLLQHRPVLTSVVVKQGSEESGDDDLLLKMENDWNLQVQSTTY